MLGPPRPEKRWILSWRVVVAVPTRGDGDGEVSVLFGMVETERD
jgi:hypothetical protein